MKQPRVMGHHTSGGCKRSMRLELLDRLLVVEVLHCLVMIVPNATSISAIVAHTSQVSTNYTHDKEHTERHDWIQLHNPYSAHDAGSKETGR